MTTEVVLHASVQKRFEALPKLQTGRLLKWARKLQEDPQAGTRITPQRIPRSLRRDFDAENLWRIPLPDGWRALYTIRQKESKTEVIFLWLGDHVEYNRLMGYK